MKKLLSIILMASMIVTLTPIACGGALTQNVAYADSGNTGSGDGSVATTPVTPTITWTETQDANDSSKNIKTASVTSESELTTAIGAVNNAEANTTWVIKLDGDIAIGSTLNITKIVTLDLNGHVLSLAQDKTGSVIKVTDGGLTLEDSNTSTEHKFSQTAKGQWYLDDTNGTKVVTGGVITGGNSENGGGVYVDLKTKGEDSIDKNISDAFTMTDGTIFGCNAKEGGGVYIGAGFIVPTSASDSDIDKVTIFTMEGGAISDCNAEKGGGVCITGVEYSLSRKSDKYPTFNMKGGTIRNCHASNNAGGVYVDNNSDRNKTKSIFNMSGGLIEGCTAKNTSAVYVTGVSSFNMSGGIIRNSKSFDNKEAVCIDKADFTLKKGAAILDIINWLERSEDKESQKLQIDTGVTVYPYYDGADKIIEKVNDIRSSSSQSELELCDFILYGIEREDGNETTTYAKQVLSDKSVSYESVARPANPSIPGYAFDGKWYEDENNGVLSDKYDFDSEDRPGNLHARMTMKTNYTIKFDTGGGTTIANNTGVSWKGEVLKKSSANGGTEDIETPTRAGYTFKGWIYKGRELTTDGWVDKDINVTSDTTYKTLVPDDDAENDTITLVAQWEKDPVSYGGGSSRQHPTVAETEHGTITLSSNGRTATITPDEGYEIASVTVNSEDKGAVSTLTGLRTGDKIAATFQKTKATLDAETKAAVASLSSLKARSSKTQKGNIKVVAKLSTAEKTKLTELTDLGYTVKYRFYRSTKKSSGYKAMLEGTTGTYYNTSGESGTRYYYKCRVMVYDANGTLVAKTALKDCKYATRKF